LRHLSAQLDTPWPLVLHHVDELIAEPSDASRRRVEQRRLAVDAELIVRSVFGHEPGHMSATSSFGHVPLLGLGSAITDQHDELRHVGGPYVDVHLELLAAHHA
jgi:hypothetical protein